MAEKEISEIIESLNTSEQKILSCLKEKSFEALCKKSGLDETSALRALEFLSNKGILTLKIEKKKIVKLGVNGLLYKQKGLPERRLIALIAERSPISIDEAKKASDLSDNEFQAGLGALKKKALVSVSNGAIVFSGNKEEITKKTLEEHLIESLPLELDKLAPEQKFAFENLKNRKDIVELASKNEIEIKITDLGKEVIKAAEKIEEKPREMIEAVTPEIILTGSWKGKKFRRYDIASRVPKISGGKRHFVNQAVDYARKIWSEMGFKEMTGGLAQTSFWNFDALFTAQDHPVREIHDTFYIKDIKGKLPNKMLVDAVKKAHEKGVAGSKGWGYIWSEDEAKRVILRTHTTCLSAQTLAALSKEQKKSGRFFAISKCFRNETVDYNHLFEFNQTEGIVVDKNANFVHLLGYLKTFLNKMGFKKIRFRPHFFPYTEPSVEADVYNEANGKWIEILGAGIFRPEVIVPLLGEYIPVLAWGMGFDRIIMENYNIKDIRELYENSLDKSREIKFW